VNGWPCIITVADGRYNVYRFSLDALPRGQATGWGDEPSTDSTSITRVASALIPTDAHEHDSDDAIVDVQWSSQGLDVMCKLYNDGCEDAAPRAYTRISFLPTASLHPPASSQAGSSPVIVENILEGKICEYHSNSHSPWLFASTQSGNYKAVIIHDDFAESDNARSHASLHLLQFDGDWESPSVQDRQLELPFYIDLLEIYAIAMDERCGVIYLSHGSGHLFTVPYG